MTDDEAVQTIRRIADIPPAPDPLRAALARFLQDGHIDEPLYHADAVYHGIISLIRRALS